VRTVGIDHEVERLAELDEPVHQPFGPLVVDVVVARTVDHEEAACQAFRERDR